MPDFRDYLIEVGARALCKCKGYDPDFVLRSRDEAVREYAYIDGQPAPNWKRYAQDATIVIDAIFEHRKQEAAQNAG